MELQPDVNAQDIAEALSARKVGSEWVALCPAHDDRNPSLSIRVRDGRVLVHCHAGCSQASVLAALRERGLWNTSPSATDHVASNRVIVQTYDYLDEQSRLLYQICRYEPKTFRPRRPDGIGGWSWGYANVRRVLYRLPAVLEAPIVFLVEGEKDVDRLFSCGFVATTNSGGSEAAWLTEYTESLRGREVVLIPDNDRPGRRRVLRIARALFGQAARLTILELAGAKDVSEWFDQGHSELELIRQLETENAVRVAK